MSNVLPLSCTHLVKRPELYANQKVLQNIFSNRPFRVSHSQNEGYINTWFSQEGRTASFDACTRDPDYIYNMATQGPFDSGMVFTAQVHGN